MSPVNSRQALPDRLRGAALLGIVVVNAAFLGISADGFTTESIQGSANRVTAFLVIVLAQGKFYLLFSFLFGYSASFILRDNSQPNRRRYLRRLPRSRFDTRTPSCFLPFSYGSSFKTMKL